METNAIARRTEMIAVLGKKQHPVESFADASAKFCAMRDAAGTGASRTPNVLIYVDGRPVANIAYNGKVFPGMPADWYSGIVPLFDPYANTR